MQIAPVTPACTHVRLEPLAEHHLDELFAATRDPELWVWSPSPILTREQMQAWYQKAMEGQARGTDLPFAVVLQTTGQVVGSTRYMDIRPRDEGLEIGTTFLSKDVWRTAVNTECKYLLLRHAFETLGALRVQLKTDGRNIRSQNAIRRIGGVYEGTLRKHMRLHDGFIRDTVYFSILADEWPDVKGRLEAMLRR